MRQIVVTLTQMNSERACALAQAAGKTPDQLINEAFERFMADEEREEHRKFLEWKETAARVAGMWKDRDDLPDFEEQRKSWDRGYGLEG
jgi:hypothetical protein